MRKDGKFVGSDGSVPEGQGILMAHLNECHQLLEMVSIYSLLGGPVSDQCSNLKLKESLSDEDEDY